MIACVHAAVFGRNFLSNTASVKVLAEIVHGIDLFDSTSLCGTKLEHAMQKRLHCSMLHYNDPSICLQFAL